MNDQNANPNPEPADDQDPLAEAESIVNEAAANWGPEDVEADPATASAPTEPMDPLAEAEIKAAEHLADLQRLQAEYVNYRKRVDRDRDTAGEQATVKVVEALIPVLDDIAAAREHGDLEGGPFAAIATKLEESLARFGWASFGAVGEEFDPQMHEALTSQPSADVTVPTIQVLAQPGHRIGERVVRPARVVVAQPED